MKEKTTTKLTANTFLAMWKNFNLLAHESGISETALRKYECGNSDWLNYFLYYNNYQAIGQTLLVYCLREELDIAATDYFSNFDLTGFELEPVQEHHHEEAGIIREALTDTDLLQIASVQDKAEVKRILPKLMRAEGLLKVLVLPVLGEEELPQYVDFIQPKLSKGAIGGEQEYVVLLPVVDNKHQIKWNYLVYDGGPVAPQSCEK